MQTTLSEATYSMLRAKSTHTLYKVVPVHYSIKHLDKDRTDEQHWGNQRAMEWAERLQHTYVCIHLYIYSYISVSVCVCLWVWMGLCLCVEQRKEEKKNKKLNSITTPSSYVRTKDPLGTRGEMCVYCMSLFLRLWTFFSSFAPSSSKKSF